VHRTSPCPPFSLTTSCDSNMKHFKSATTGVASKTMRNELNRLVQTVSDPNTKRVRLCLFTKQTPFSCSLRFKVFDTEMQSFFYLFTRYLTEKANSQELYVIPTRQRRLTAPTLAPAIGIASSRPRPTKSSRTISCPRRPAQRH
jgi:hypothetical protein